MKRKFKQFHQYQQNEQPHLITSNWHKKDHIDNPCHLLVGQAQYSGVVKPVQVWSSQEYIFAEYSWKLKSYSTFKTTICTIRQIDLVERKNSMMNEVHILFLHSILKCQ